MAIFSTSGNVLNRCVENLRLAVNLIASQVGIAGGSGAASDLTVRTVTASDSPEVTAAQVMDDWDESDRCKVNLIVGKAGIATDAGAVGDTVPRVTVASDAPVVAHVEETLATVVNGTDGTYEYFLDLDGYRAWAVQFTLSGGSGTVTVTCEATLQDDGTAANACTYQNVTLDLFAVASATASGIWICDNVFPAKYVKIKVVAATGGANDADWTIYSKRLF